MSSRKRKPNWTEQECLLLAQLLQERKEAIRGKCGIEVSIQDKRQAWKQVAQSINNVFPQIHRTVYDCNKKWENLLAKSKVEIKRQKRQAGTGLSVDQLTTVTQVVVSVMGISDMLHHNTEDSPSSGLLEIKKNR
uniref:Myb-like domain-containing protein n=1 Tax=Gasterosteus aculeatus TaxID=69293 RepID=G3P059_GASAC